MYYEVGSEKVKLCIGYNTRLERRRHNYCYLRNQQDPIIYLPPRDRNLPSQPISIQEAQSEKKTTNLCAPLEFLKNVSAMFDNHTISLLFLQMSKQTFRMFTLCDHLLFGFCSLHLDVLRCAKNHGLFYLNYPQINEVRKYDHMARFTQFL